MSADVRTPKNYDEGVQLASEAAIIASGNSDEVKVPQAGSYAFLFDLTSAGTANGDKLDVYVQTRINDTWVNVAHFVQIDGDQAAAKHVEKIAASEAQAGIVVGAALAEGEVQNILGDGYRVKWVITDVTTPTFDFNVWAMPMGA